MKPQHNVAKVDAKAEFTGVNEHFKPTFNDGLASAVVMLRSLHNKNMHSDKIKLCLFLTTLYLVGDVAR